VSCSIWFYLGIKKEKSLTDKLFSIVGVTTQGKTTKFRVANGDIESRVKVLERAGCTDINFISLAQPMTKQAAIAEYQRQFPESLSVSTPKNQQEKSVAPRRKRATLDAAIELLNQVESH
jgi:hypothetical protein